ncbi:MAG: hypothetical protein C5B51_26905 [Terriglobia bacterium]|nr:MAG: hypothetical protein C5B51_26905 [Terriglobia bacterium]
MPDGILRLRILDVYGDFLNEKVDIFLRHQTLSDDPSFRQLDAGRIIEIKNLNQSPQGLYRLEVDALSYQAVSQFVNIASSGATEKALTLPVDHNKVVGVEFPPFGSLAADGQTLLANSSQVLGFENKSGGDLYGALDDIRRAGFLNLIAKSARTRLTNNRTVLSYIQELTEVRGDRFFAVVDAALHGETKNAVVDEIFHSVDDALHTPPPGFEMVDSYKTFDHYGNLQLTFSATPDRSRWQVDMDIDDAQGFEHIFQVIRNIGGATHPYDIHEILIAYQEIDPGYRLMLHPVAQSARG